MSIQCTLCSIVDWFGEWWKEGVSLALHCERRTDRERVKNKYVWRSTTARNVLTKRNKQKKCGRVYGGKNWMGIEAHIFFSCALKWALIRSCVFWIHIAVHKVYWQHNAQTKTVKIKITRCGTNKMKSVRKS